MKLVVKFVKKDVSAQIPSYESEGAAGFDFYAHSFLKVYNGYQEVNMSKLQNNINKGYVVLRPFERVLVGTGIYCAIPKGYEIQIRDRSSLTLKKGLKVFNAPGTIDSDYRGEVGIIMLNNTNSLQKIFLGERIAQGVLASVDKAEFFEVKSLDETKRGEGGFGSTGTK